MVGVKSMVYFWDSIHLDPYCPLHLHLFTNTPVVKDKRVEFFHCLISIKSLSSHLVSIDEQKIVFFWIYWSFWKGNSARWDVNSVTSNDFQSMKTSVFSLNLCKKENT